MRQAEKFRRPIITLIDTSGAYPGLEAEERGQGEAIARNLFETVSYTHLSCFAISLALQSPAVPDFMAVSAVSSR